MIEAADGAGYGMDNCVSGLESALAPASEREEKESTSKLSRLEGSWFVGGDFEYWLLIEDWCNRPIMATYGIDCSFFGPGKGELVPEYQNLAYGVLATRFPGISERRFHIS